jgi:hypothetical protein
MSHLGTYKTSIANANATLLKMALEYLVKLRAKDGAFIDNKYSDYSGFEHKADLVYKDRLLHRGMSVFIKDGAIQFLGDNYGDKGQFAQIQKQFEQVYKALAAIASAKADGFTNVEIKEGQDGRLLIRLSD